MATDIQVGDVITLRGTLGAGKTTIVRMLLEKCGVYKPITSPTFTYVNVYENKKDQLFYHFDLYRLNSIDDFIEAGFNEFLYLENSWAFIEWPKIVMPLLTKHACNVTIDYHCDDKRIVTFSVSE